MPHVGFRWSRQFAAAMLVLIGSCRTTTAPEEQVITLEIAAATVPCTGVGPHECLQVRSRADGPWELFYDSIDGFRYEAGYRYSIRVGVRTVSDPPADGSDRSYRLLAVLSKIPG